MNKKDDILNVDNFWASTFETLVPLRFSTLKLTCSLKQNFCRLFHVLTQLLLTTNEMEVYYDHKKVNLRVSSHAAEQLKTKEFGDLKRIPEILWLDDESQSATQRADFHNCARK